MIKHLKLFGCNGRFAEDADYIRADNDGLIIEITTNFGFNTILYAKINNGLEEKSIKIINKRFEIKNDFLNVGECHIKIVAMVGNKIVGNYTCPSILIREIDNNRIIVDELQNFKLDIQQIKCELEAYKEFIDNELIKMQKTIKQLIIAE